MWISFPYPRTLPPLLPFYLLRRISNRVLPSAFIRIYIIFSCCCYVCFFLGLFSFFLATLPCFSFILHPRWDAKWAIKARFDCGPDVLNGSDVRIAFAIRHSPLALPNPKVHANKNNLSSYPTLSTYRRTVRYGIPRTARSIQSEGAKPPNAHRCEIALGQQRLGVRIPGVPYTIFVGGERGLSVFRLYVSRFFLYFLDILLAWACARLGAWMGQVLEIEN